MSSYIRNTKHPVTGKYEAAFWIDDFFGHHNYGVQFSEGETFDARDYTFETNYDPPTGEVKWPKVKPQKKTPTKETPVVMSSNTEELQDALYNNVLNFPVARDASDNLVFLDDAYPKEFKAMEQRAMEFVTQREATLKAEYEEKIREARIEEWKKLFSDTDIIEYWHDGADGDSLNAQEVGEQTVFHLIEKYRNGRFAKLKTPEKELEQDE